MIGTSNRRTTRTIERLLLGRYEPTPEEQLGTLEWQELHLPPELENLWLGEPAALQLVDQNRAIIALSTPGDLVLLDVTGLPERPVISRHWISETINIRGGEMDIAIRYVDPPVVILATSVAGSSTRIAAHRLSDLTPLWERELPGADTLALSASPNEIRAVTTDWSAHSGTSLTLTRDREGTSKSIQLPFLTEALDVHALFMAEGQLVLAGRLHGGVTRVGLFSEGGRLLSAVEFEGVVPQALNRGLNGQIQVVLQCYPSATHLRTLGLDPDTLATCSNSIVLREKRQVRRVRPVLLAEDSSIYAVGSE